MSTVPETLAYDGAIVTTAVWGTLARLGLIALGKYDGAPVESTVLAQAVGCFVFGLAEGLHDVMVRVHPSAKAWIHTGLCGSITTFSSWMLNVFAAFANSPPSRRRHGLHNVVDAFTQTALTLAVATAGLRFGRQCGAYVASRVVRPDPDGKHTPRVPGTVENIALITLGAAHWIGAAALAGWGPHRWRHRATFAAVFGPAGALIRAHAAPLNTSPLAKRVDLPIGTLSINLFGTVVAAALTLAAYTPPVRANGLQCTVVNALISGFAGDLTTVSSFANELLSSRPRRQWRYAVLSWVVGQLICIVIIGSYSWSHPAALPCKAG